LPRGEPQPERGAECPEPPSFLGEYAREEWARVAPSLWHSRLLTVLDIGPLSAYCATYAHWRTCEELLARQADRTSSMEDGDGLIVYTAEGRPRQNPLVKLAAAAASDMLRYAAGFGMTPAARSKVAAGVGPPPSKFDGLIETD
jgi:P27 family predicted phage terminase small subunit